MAAFKITIAGTHEESRRRPLDLMLPAIRSILTGIGYTILHEDVDWETREQAAERGRAPMEWDEATEEQPEAPPSTSTDEAPVQIVQKGSYYTVMRGTEVLGKFQGKARLEEGLAELGLPAST